MSTLAERLSIEQFRQRYDNGAKPHFEFWNGEARQKAMPTKLHARLQWILAAILAELGFFPFTELTLRNDPDWQPVPDVAATVSDFSGIYPTAPVDIVVEILSPEDAFSDVERKCERYAAGGIAVILVFEPVERKVWRWDQTLISLIKVRGEIVPLHVRNAALDVGQVWARLDAVP